MDGLFGKAMELLQVIIVKDTDVSDLSNGPDYLTAVGNTLFFTSYDQVNGYSLWILKKLLILWCHI